MITEFALSEVARSTSSAENAKQSIGGATNDSFFSTKLFVDAWVRSFGGSYRPLAIPVRTSGPPRTMYGIETRTRVGLRSISIGPDGFYGSPGWDCRLDPSTPGEILRFLQGIRTTRITWNVRFDHEPLARSLITLGLAVQQQSTHVLRLEQDYEHIFVAFNATIRNQIRRARRHGMLVQATDSPEHLRIYYDLYTRRIRQKGGYSFVFPLSFLGELLTLTDVVRLFIVPLDRQCAGGGLFLRDGCSVFYLHSAYNDEYSHLHPMSAVLDAAIRWACEMRASFFNFGGSGGIASLEQFKSFWGARPERNWVLEWVNPLWERLSIVEAGLRRRLHV